MKKTCGIITFSAADNFGALMQCYALRKKMTAEGYETKVLNYWPQYLREPYRVMFNKEELKVGMKSGLKCLWRSVIYVRFKNLPRAISKKKKMNAFRKKYLGLTKKCRNIGELEKLPSMNLYITGSDQVWNPEITGGKLDMAFFLTFAPEGAKKISYAASTGSVPKEDYMAEYCSYIKGLDKISVREKTSVKALQEITDKPIEVDDDPTLLYDSKEYDTLISKPSEKGQYILFYSLYYTQEQFDYVNELSERLGCPVKHYFYGRLAKRLKNNGGTVFFDSPQEILSKIKYATYVVSDSFHVTVFSILFNKEFTTFRAGNWSERIENLLEKYNMTDRLMGGK